LIVILSKRSLRSEGSGRAARRVAHSARNNHALRSLPYQTEPIQHSYIDNHRSRFYYYLACLIPSKP
jgi:hypothetical protein